MANHTKQEEIQAKIEHASCIEKWIKERDSGILVTKHDWTAHLYRGSKTARR